RLHIYPLPFPDKYRACIRQSGGDGLYPEQTCRRLLNRNVDTACRPKAGDKNSSMPAAAKVKKIPGWQTFDPRVTWLMETLDALKPDKVLVICASAQTALELEQVLRTRAGIPAAAFHEGMNIVRRDRVAAWFAEQEDGAQVLVCSEIGSEGRNFQFAHHLVLFDLPLNPDLLEQRIGRLDRIGQKQTIQIHVPYLRDSAQEILFRWYHEGLNAFAHTCPSAAGVFSQLRPELLKNFQQATALLSQYSSKDTPPLPEHDALSSLINSSRALYQEINERLKRGHDRLLELNSCRKEQAEALRKEIVKIDRDSSPRTYMEQVFDCFGVDFEEHSALNYIVKPGNHMLVPAFPELPADGVTVTFDRTTALAREDMQFLTWEHPMVRGAMDLVLTSEHGNAAVLVLENPYIKQGSLLLETIFLVECSAPKYLQTGCYLPPTVLRFLLDQEFRDLSEELPCERLTEQAADVSQSVAAEIVRSRRELIREVLARSEQLARLRLPGIIAAARQRISDTLNAEIKRLLALQQVNLNVRTEEIDFQRHLLADLEKHIQAAQLRLDAVRVAITR
ncbi:MAG: RNA polymerase-associated protein RapA, partial [Gammaproteobacteria bacterium]|nr:RNA polymerase-associated protein RapA [Gammaproteobacteria bacterium]